MAEQIKYVSLSNLTKYDGKIKTYISDADVAVKEALEAQIDIVANAITSEETRAKAAESANADAAAAAQSAADSVDAKVGTLPSSAATVIDYIDAKTANIASDDTVNALAERVTQAEKDIDAVENRATALETAVADRYTKSEIDEKVDALNEANGATQGEVDALEQTVANNKSAIEGTVAALQEVVDTNESDIEDKMTTLTSRVAANETAVGTTLPNAIAAEQARAEEAEAGLQTQINTIMNNPDAEGAINSINEFTKYVEDHGTIADGFRADIDQNKEDIKAVEGRLGTAEGKISVAEGKITTLEGQMGDAQGDIAALQAAIADGGSVDSAISEAIEEEVTRVDEELAKKVDKVEGYGLSKNDLSDTLKANYDAAYAHSQEAHAPVDAQANIIESVKVNGSALTITGKAVDITVPTDNAELANGAGYLVANDIANKADKGTTLADYGIADAYTSAETDSAIADAIAQFEELTEAEINALFV